MALFIECGSVFLAITYFLPQMREKEYIKTEIANTDIILLFYVEFKGIGANM